METIEERAMILAEDSSVLHGTQKAVYKACVEIATEQDQIARKEERERCVNVICNCCQDRMFCLNNNCMYINNIRKKIEEGGNK